MNKNIAIVASWLHPIRQKHLIDWYSDLSSENLTTQLFLGSRNKSIPEAINFKLNTKRDKLKHTFSNLNYLKPKSSELKKIQPLVDYDPEIIHLLTSNAFESIEPILKNKNIKLIVSFRGFDINVFPKQSKENLMLTQRIFKAADILHFISDNLKNTAVGLGADPEKCIVIHRSIRINPDEDFIRSSSGNNKLVILSVGRLVWEKGYLYALETIGILKNKGYDFEYQVAGSGIDYSMLIFHVNRLNIQDRVNFLGELTREEIKERLCKANIYFQPSLSEALSMAIIEASYSGLPIVSSNIGGIPEVIENHVSGFLSDSCNPDGYVENIISLVENEGLRNRIGSMAHKQIVEKFSREMEVEKWKEVYFRLVN